MCMQITRDSLWKCGLSDQTILHTKNKLLSTRAERGQLSLVAMRYLTPYPTNLRINFNYQESLNSLQCLHKEMPSCHISFGL